MALLTDEELVTAQELHGGRYLRTGEVARILHVERETVTRWARKGKLPHVRTLGGHFRFPEAEIRELAASLRVEAVKR